MNDVLKAAAEAIKQGKTLLYPTDTVWGLGCDASNANAVAEVSKLKGRTPDKSYIILVDNDGRLQRHVRNVPEVAWDIIDNSDRPITLIYPQGMAVAPEVLADDGSIAIRITKNEFLQKLIQRANRPLLSTSSNLTGEPTPKDFESIPKSIKDSVGHIVDLQPPVKSDARPSSIIKLGLGGEVQIIRR